MTTACPRGCRLSARVIDLNLRAVMLAIQLALGPIGQHGEQAM